MGQQKSDTVNKTPAPTLIKYPLLTTNSYHKCIMARTAGCPTLHDDEEHHHHHHIHQHPTPTTTTSSAEDVLYQPTPQIQVKPTSFNDDDQQHNDIPPSQYDVTKRRGSQSVPPPALKSSTSCLSPPSVPRRPHSVRFSPEPPEVFHYPAAPHEKTPKAKLFLPWEGDA